MKPFPYSLSSDSLPIRTAKAKEGSICNHPVHDRLFDGDELTSLSDCPFPLKTDSFEVLAFGKRERDDGPEAVAVVAYRKGCGHLAHDRIGFFEHVKDFQHGGTPFKGDDYKIANWEKRIAYFQSTPCEVCDMARHQAWLQTFQDTRQPGKKRLATFRLLMNANWENWQEFVSEAEFIKAANLKNL
ncbi:MAG: hypothetical protein ACK5XN_40200 [Bacteroidota bacterium]|jgi:hypothetical protein